MMGKTSYERFKQREARKNLTLSFDPENTQG
jgi:hypothetical protein